MTDTDLRQRELELEYRSFLDDEATDGIYKSKVEHMIKRGETRLIVEINDMKENPDFKERAEGLIENPVEELVAFQHALKEYVISLDPTYGRSKYEFQIGLCGSFGSRHVTPRTLTSRFLNQTVCVEGVVSKVSLMEGKIVKLVFYCPATKKTTQRGHYDLSSLEYQRVSNIMETTDEEGNPVQVDCGQSKCIVRQTITLNEMPEVVPVGQLTHSVQAILEEDLVDRCRLGDRVRIVGTYKCLTNQPNCSRNSVSRLVVMGNNVELMSKEVSTTQDEGKQGSKTEMFEKLNLLLHGRRNVRDKYLNIEFMRKYIHIAKRLKPQLTEEARLMIEQHQSNLRKIDTGVADLAKTQPITASRLETLIRLSTAHAKARLSTKVEAEDAAEAINLVQQSCYHKVLSKPKFRPQKKRKPEHEDDIEGDDETTTDKNETSRRRRRVLSGSGGGGGDEDNMDVDNDGQQAEDDDENNEHQISALTEEQKEAIKAKLPAFLELINNIARKEYGVQRLNFDTVYKEAETMMKIGRSEVDILIALMQEKEFAVLDNNFLYLVG